MAQRCKFGIMHDTEDAPGYECAHCENERLRADLAECKRDAERYRALKKAGGLHILHPDCYDFEYLLPSELDALLAALAEKGEE